MAKVKIQGHASGTGVLTVTAPNTSTDRTITLPDGTGTLLNSDGSGANLTNLPNGSQLDHSGTKKIEAVSTGIDVTGILSCNNNMIVQGGGSASQITMKDSGGTVDGYVYAETGAVGFLDVDGHWAIKHTNDTNTTFLINNAEKVRILSSGGITFNGDTAAANALDDYEEGTFTPTILSATGLSITNNKSIYTKIGRLVHFYLYINIGSGGIPNDNEMFKIGGLPFSPQSSNYHPPATIAYSGNIQTNFVYPILHPNYIYAHRGDGNSTDVKNSNVAGLSALIIGGSYEI